MKILLVILLIAQTFPSSKAKDLYEYTKDNVLSKPKFEELKLLAQFLIDNAAESIKPTLEENFNHAFTTKWKSSNEFDKYVTDFLSKIENQIFDAEDKTIRSRSKR
ncbi:uncharacterized protein LOC131672191 [Phymastichus coffea]|uniref:uncharacterized protein LOC131672191 n=1 Tax=Phymastichus coffea TaxID=108790 RepID=UPI00273B125C|nr:uncharacterized protein LOC131672191 [Phymastichus coffea]